MTRTKTLAVVGVVLLVALAGCGGTDPDNVSEPTDGVGTDGVVGGETTDGAGTDDGGLGDGEETTDGEMTTTEDGVGEETTEGMETTDGEGTDDETTTAGEGTDGETTTDGEGTDGAAGGASEAAVTFEDQSSNGSAVNVSNVTLPNGGFVAVHNVTEDGQVADVLGNSSFLESGDYENLTVTFENASISEETDLIVMLYEDTNDNQMYDYPADDSPYMVDGEPVVANATVTVSDGGAATDGGTDTGTETESGTGTDEGTETTES